MGVNLTPQEKGGEPPPPPPFPGRPAYVEPLSPQRQAPASMACVTNSDRPQPLLQPPPTPYPTASGVASGVRSLLMQPCSHPRPFVVDVALGPLPPHLRPFSSAKASTSKSPR